MNYAITTLDQLRPILVGFRKSRGLTQAALAAKLGIAQQTYAQLEANPGVASVERLFKLLRVLGVELVLSAGGANQSQAPQHDIATGSRSSYLGTQTPPPDLTVREKAPDQPDDADGKTDAARRSTAPRKREAW